MDSARSDRTGNFQPCAYNAFASDVIDAGGRHRMDQRWTDSQLEQQVLDTITLDEPWALVERFSTLVRLSGSPEEAEAVSAITEKLTSWNIPHTVHHPTCLISLPGPATLRTLGDGGKSYTVKTPAFSPHSNGE